MAMVPTSVESVQAVVPSALVSKAQGLDAHSSKSVLHLSPTQPCGSPSAQLPICDLMFEQSVR